MSDLKNAILDARYVDMIDLADFIARDCNLPLRDENGDFLPQANEISAAIFRWAADASAASPRIASLTDQPDIRPLNTADALASFETIATTSQDKGRSAS